MLRRALHHVTRPISRVLLRTLTLSDPWHRIPLHVPLARFGSGARRDFSWYLEGHSRVDVSTVGDVLDWLATCQYVRDRDLFREDDYWQHPTTLEQIRRGDCEDFSLWAWRKLRRLGFSTEFVAGFSLAPEGVEPHTWVQFTQDDTVYLLDAVAPDPSLMLHPLSQIRSGYLPEVSVDSDLQRYVYAGYSYHRSGKA